MTCVVLFLRSLPPCGKTAVSSAPLLTQFMFDWSVDQVGVLMAVLGLMVLPVNVMVGRLSQVVEDRSGRKPFHWLIFGYLMLWSMLW